MPTPTFSDTVVLKSTTQDGASRYNETSLGDIPVSVFGGAASTGAWRARTYVDASFGSDATGGVGRPDKPFATIAAAHAACIAAGGDWWIQIERGTYTDSGLTPGTSGNSIYYHYVRGAVHVVTGANHLFNWTGNNPTIEYVITGDGSFQKNSNVTGLVITTAWATSNCLRFVFHANGVLCAAGYGANSGLIRLEIAQQSLTNQANGEFFVNRYDAQNGSAPLYFRVGGNFPQVDVRAISMIRGVHFDQGLFYCFGEAYDAIEIGLNNFAQPQVMFFSTGKIKGTDQSAIKIRTGFLRVQGGNIEVTNAGADAVSVTSDAAASSGINMNFVSTAFVERGQTTSFKAIRYNSVGSNIKTRLMNCFIGLENGATPAITASGAITIDAIGSLFSNVTPGDGNVTFRGATPVVDSNFYTGFWF
jgi:hypothetical protein